MNLLLPQFISLSTNYFFFPMAPVHTPLDIEAADDIKPTEVSSIKALIESGDVSSFPSKYTFMALNPNDQANSNDPEDSIPTIDFTLLTSASPEQRPKILQDLRKACEEWGFFMVYQILNKAVPFIHSVNASTL